MKQLYVHLFFSAIYFMYLSTFVTVSLQKITGGVPDWFIKQFDNTFISRLPGGARFGFWTIAILETLVAIIFALALLLGEWGFTSDLYWLPLGISLSAFTFALLGFGLRIAGDFQGAANLFIYFASSFIVLIALSLKPFAV